MVSYYSKVVYALLLATVRALPEESCVVQRGEVSGSLLQTSHRPDGSFSHAGSGESPAAHAIQQAAESWPEDIQRSLTGLKDKVLSNKKERKNEWKHTRNITETAARSLAKITKAQVEKQHAQTKRSQKMQKRGKALEKAKVFNAPFLKRTKDGATVLKEKIVAAPSNGTPRGSKGLPKGVANKFNFAIGSTKGSTKGSYKGSVKGKSRTKGKGVGSGQGMEAADAEEIIQEGVNFLKGCKHVFFDLGANRGTHVRKLFEPEQYPESNYLTVFDHAFGTERSRPFEETGICAVGFEANPRWKETLDQVEKAYTEKGWKVHFFVPVAVSDTNDHVEFFFNDYNRDNEDMGFSLRKRHDWAEAIDITTLDFPAFTSAVLEHTDPGYKLIKMDIEAAEYPVLPKFLERKLLCENSINEMTIEWHDRMLSEDENEMADELRSKLYYSLDEECGEAGAGSKVHELDDETYYDVDKPLPEV